MSDFIRRLVSGDKARFKDGELDIDLDLVYITDRVVVMGYPAAGIEGLYRNRREDAKKFLQHRHGKSFWVFNFCPVKENSYPSSVFDGRVSRYPFPDHHVPPLAILPLVAREMHAWLSGSPERVAVLHCKAGKGRSGTMACAYLLTLGELPIPPRLERSRSSKERATYRAERIMNAMLSDGTFGEAVRPDDSTVEEDPVRQELDDVENGGAVKTDDADKPELPSTDGGADNLSRILELHTSRRMRRPSSPTRQAKQGVSIPSQRRWLYYWSLLLAQQGPPHFWSADPGTVRQRAPKVRLTQIRVRMRELSGVKASLVRAANAIIERTSFGKAPSSRVGAAGKGQGLVWASLARYDDELVGLLEKWERHTRDEGGSMGRRTRGAGHIALGDVFEDGRWDDRKMVRSFARLGTAREPALQKEVPRTEGKVVTEVLRPLTGDSWNAICETIEHDAEGTPVASNNAESEETSMHDVTQTPKGDGGVLLDANREVRVKLYVGQVFMGWFWFIPAFHMSQPCASGPWNETMVLRKEEIDFPLGAGSSIIDAEICMAWYPEATDVIAHPKDQ